MIPWYFSKKTLWIPANPLKWIDGDFAPVLNSLLIAVQ